MHLFLNGRVYEQQWCTLQVSTAPFRLGRKVSLTELDYWEIPKGRHFDLEYRRNSPKHFYFSRELYIFPMVCLKMGVLKKKFASFAPLCGAVVIIYQSIRNILRCSCTFWAIIKITAFVFKFHINSLGLGFIFMCSH